MRRWGYTRNDDAAVMGKATDNTGAEPGTGDVMGDVGSKPGTGDPILEPGMEVVIGDADVEPGTGFTLGKQAQLLNCSNSKVLSAVAVQPPVNGSAANYDSDHVVVSHW